VSGPTVAELVELGLHDPDQPDAAQRLELLEYLVGLGATAEDLVAYRDGLAGLATVLGIRGGEPLTVAETAARAGVPHEKLLRVMRAAGFPEPGPDDRILSARFADIVAAMQAAETVFGEDAVLQFVRVMGSAMARLADAMVSMFLINVEPRVRDEDPVGLGLARANAEAAALVPAANQALDILLRQHLIAARRTIIDDSGAFGYETQLRAVGFIDLVGSTALAQRVSTRELGVLLTNFENDVADSVTSHRGRVVKLIGDAVLYVADDESSACAIALELAKHFDEHPTLPAVRAGIACGDVLIRDGDVFGPVVNLAARAVKAASAGQVVAPVSVATAAGVEAESLGPQDLKGIDEEVELCRLLNGKG